MQTSFNALQLGDPTIARVDEILRRCVPCELVAAPCPTYVLTRDERDSTRGRVNLIKQMFESGKVTSTMVHHIDRCPSCLGRAACPSGVDYMHLVNLARVRIEQRGHRGASQRMMRWFVSRVLANPYRFKALLALGWFARPFRHVFAKMGLPRVAAALELVPANALKLKILKPKSAYNPKAPHTKRVAIMLGCVQEVLAPQINQAAMRLLRRHGIDVMVVKDEGSSGAVAHSLGHEEEAQGHARHNIDALTALMRERLLDAIIVTDGGRGAMLKDYGNLLARDRGYAERAEYVSGLARDITEYLDEIGLNPPVMWTGLKVAYHSACSLRHGQKLEALPRALLEQAGYTLTDIPEGHLCCGSAGVYNILQPDLAGQLRDRMLKNIESISPDVIVVGNIGCMALLQGGTDVPIVHTVELLDWATGGPCPPALSKLRHRANPIEALVEMAKTAAKERELVD
ncbi:glycolate oxidase subunit GlcF [Methyloceanibacter marginalis]|jgi:glycolate dehydrogenase iron-sulfur subunit|uniref:glycolate oxidase subunit GlcF n=1 Tax=Methyloceanibacter marginalis TaxID=1774971 RepID=UPI00084C4F5F|nr:glycolate oxidase subunit GlcF [Methyloceanibacter marginalis]